ncbi:MAG: hypothetical protein WC655_00035 [Candidatus Hydrogenedentales bacterium]|jgi:hypothetical protein
MTAPTQVPETPPKRRRLRRVLLFVGIVLPFAILLWTGWPQTKLVEWAAGKALGASVDVEGLSLIPSVRIRSVVVAAESYAKPLLRVENAQLDYAMSLKRPLTALSVYRVALHVDASDPAATNYAFLMKEPKSATSEGNLPSKYLPRTVAVERIDLKVDAPQASMKLDGMRLEASFGGSLIPSGRLSGEHIAGFVQGEDTATRQEFSDGVVNINLDNGDPMAISARVAIPDAIALEGSLETLNLFIIHFATLKLQECRINGSRIAGLLSLFSPMPVSFEQLDLSGTQAVITFGESQVALLKSTINVAAEGVVLGAAGSELYEGDFALTGAFADQRLEGEARLNRGQRMKVIAEGNVDKGTGAATLLAWSREDFAAALPVTVRPFLEQVPGLRQVEGTFEATWNLPSYTMNLSIDPVLAPSAGKQNQLSVTASGTGTTDAAFGPMLDGKGTLRLGKGQCDVSAIIDSSTRLKGNASLKDIDPNRILAALGWPELPQVDTEALKGAVKFDMNGEAVTLDMDLAAGPVRAGALEAPADKPLEVKGTLVANTKSREFRSKALAIRLTDNGALTLNDLGVELGPLVATANVTGKLDFDYLAPDLGISGLSGAVEIDAPLRYKDGAVSGKVALKGDGFGYGGLASPYGTPIIVTGTARYDTKDGTGTLAGLNVLWGDGTSATSENLALASLSPVTLGGELAVATDLRPLVDLRLLDSSDGSGNVKGTVGYAADGPRADLAWDVTARSFVLADALAALGGVTAKGSLRYNGAPSGEGKFHVANAAAGGGLLTEVDGAFTLENGVVRADRVTATMYGGAATIDAEVDLFGPEGRGKLTAKVTGTNLETFTKEYKPPVVLLTGIAQGEVELEWAKVGITDFRVELASDKEFSLNRESVEQLLLTALTSEVPGLKFLNRRIRKKTIGDEPMRKFDTATVSLRLEGEPGENQRLTGPVALTSDTLDFTIDLGADLGAIAEGMQLSQDAQLEDIEKISTDPLQWNE